MTGSAYKPAGFCPYCDHAIDPGICPECGRNVSEKELVYSQRRQRRRRFALRISKFLFVVALVFGLGYGVYHETRPHRWVRYCSTDYLIAKFTMDFSRHCENEINTRLVNGVLDLRQLRKWLKASIIPTDISIVSPRPIDLPPEVDGDPIVCEWICRGTGPYYVMPFTPCNERSVYETLWIDGIQKTTMGRMVSKWHDVMPTVQEFDVGRHEIEVRRHVAFDCSPVATEMGFSEANQTIEVTRIDRQYVDVVESKPGSMIPACSLDEFVAELNDGAWFRVLPYLPRWSNESGSIKLAGRFKFSNVAPNRASGKATVSIRFPHDLCKMKELLGRSFSSDEMLQVTFTPDEYLAIDAGFDRFINCQIIWSNVTIVDGYPKFITPESIVDAPKRDSKFARSKLTIDSN